uniref:ABC transporter domain-containing protein n=1 Tax=Thermosporothrix sp. COM3 TaxID=2490863 RepID=A0A455SEI4_9CHLR|nr:hypothetical protein KTC_01230 [Thermosporothrix sp. COM3]
MSTPTAVPASTDTVLVMEGITKTFSGVRALKGVSIDLRAGEVHALLGQNGAGKSTLIKVLSGAHAPDSGSITMEGKTVSFGSPADALRAGIGTVYQDPLVYPELSVTENIFMGRELRDRFGNIDMRAQVKRVRELLRDLETDPNIATLPVGTLSVAVRQLVLIAKVLSWEPKVLIFDEPTAILTQREADILFGIIRKLRTRGVGIIYISHRMEEIFALADRVTVLKDGESKGTWPIQGPEALSYDRLIELMAGQVLQEGIETQGPLSDKPLLSVRHLSHVKTYQDISFDIRPGEIVGLFGLVGAGRSEVARAIFGEEPAQSGEIQLDGEVLRLRSPQQAVRKGIAYLPEDRKEQGIFGNLSITYNATITIAKRLAKLGFITNPRQEEQVTQQYVKDLAIKTPDTQTKIANLSGGNQQKVVLAKWLAAKPRLLILDEPTAGIDIAAKQEIHNLIARLASEGVAILVISSELPEILKLSDRIITMREGRQTGEFQRGASPEAVLSAAMQGKASIEQPGEQKPEQAAKETNTTPISRLMQHAAAYNRELILIAILIIGSLIFQLFFPTFLTWNNIASILSNVAVVSIIAIGMTMVIVTGGIDVSIGSVVAICMLISAKVMVAGGDNIFIALLVSLGVGLLAGALNGTIVAFGRIHPIIVTLGTMNIIRALHIDLLGPKWLTPPPVARTLALGNVFGIPIPWLLVIVLGVVVGLFLSRRPLGRAIYAIGGNPEAARLAGIRTRWVTIFVYAAIGMLIGLAALIQLGQSGTVQPNTANGLELQIIAATVIGGTNILGGRGSILGSLLGALLVAAIHNALITLGTISLLEGLVIGALIIVAVGIDMLQKRKAIKA